MNLVPLLDDVNRELDHLCTLQFTSAELNYLKNLPYFTQEEKDEFFRWLVAFKLQRGYIRAEVWKNKLHIEADGPLELVMLFEIYVLAIVNELYFQKYHPGLSHYGIKLLEQGLLTLPEGFAFADFGCRRRYSFAHQNAVLQKLKEWEAARFTFLGTSNLYFAKELNLREMGTQPHEFFQVCQANFMLRYFQKKALKLWIREFPILDTALTDTVGVDAFLRDLDQELAWKYKGYRHDSGEPNNWRRKVLNRVAELGIEPKMTKLTYSNSLNFEKAVVLHNNTVEEAIPGAGIGTFVMNNVGKDVTPLNIVMKIVMCDGQHVAKLSDDVGKGMSESPAYEAYLREVVHFPIQ